MTDRGTKRSFSELDIHNNCVSPTSKRPCSEFYLFEPLSRDQKQFLKSWFGVHSYTIRTFYRMAENLVFELKRLFLVEAPEYGIVNETDIRDLLSHCCNEIEFPREIRIMLRMVQDERNPWQDCLRTLRSLGWTSTPCVMSFLCAINWILNRRPQDSSVSGFWSFPRLIDSIERRLAMVNIDDIKCQLKSNIEIQYILDEVARQCLDQWQKVLGSKIHDFLLTQTEKKWQGQFPARFNKTTTGIIGDVTVKAPRMYSRNHESVWTEFVCEYENHLFVGTRSHDIRHFSHRDPVWIAHFVNHPEQLYHVNRQKLHYEMSVHRRLRMLRNILMDDVRPLLPKEMVELILSYEQFDVQSYMDPDGFVMRQFSHLPTLHGLLCQAPFALNCIVVNDGEDILYVEEDD